MDAARDTSLEGSVTVGVLCKSSCASNQVRCDHLVCSEESLCPNLSRGGRRVCLYLALVLSVICHQSPSSYEAYFSGRFSYCTFHIFVLKLRCEYRIVVYSFEIPNLFSTEKKKGTRISNRLIIFLHL